MRTLVRDLMVRAYVWLAAGTSVVDAARWMRDNDDQDIVVCAAGGRFLGLVSAQDLLYRCVAPGHDPGSTPLWKVLNPKSDLLRPDDTVEGAMRAVLNYRGRYLPVVEGGRLVGMLGLEQITNQLLRDEDFGDGFDPYS